MFFLIHTVTKKAATADRSATVSCDANGGHLIKETKADLTCCSTHCFAGQALTV